VSTQQVVIPDIGGAETVDVIELCVSVGDTVAKEDSLIVLETDKATMEIPAPVAGKIVALHIAVGDRITEGAALCEIELNDIDAAVSPPSQQDEGAGSEAKNDSPEDSSPEENNDSVEQDRSEVVLVPDLGGAEQVAVIEVCVAEGDDVNEEDALLVLESDKASMEIPSPFSGRIKKLLVSVDDKVSQGDQIVELLVVTSSARSSSQPAAQKSEESRIKQVEKAVEPIAQPSPIQSTPSNKVHAGPAVRRLARELGIDLAKVTD